MASNGRVLRVDPGTFEPRAHFYERVLNAQIHPLVRYFMHLGNERIAERYCHLHPEADRDAVRGLLRAAPSHFRWGGTDLFHTTTENGLRRVVVVETNSCPSGQKSTPPLEEAHEQAGYRILMQHAFDAVQRARSLPKGGLAVLYDKNHMECSGYAAAMADAFDEPVWLVPCFDGQPDPDYRFEDGLLEVRAFKGAEFVPIRAALRYVTQRPWNRIPPVARSAIFNPVLVCLAGGRNKLVAAKAYDLFNARVREQGLAIHIPETIWDVSLEQVPMWVTRMGGVAVVKDPYSNAGQGVFTITSPDELARFMDGEHRYDRFIVQALVGNRGWSSVGAAGRLYHVGTVPDRQGRIYATDLRFMVVGGPDGFAPVAIYARRAADSLPDAPPRSQSWEALGTNLSRRLPDGGWSTETDRLLLVDGRDFNRLGLGLDLLIEGYLQTVMAVTAIDDMAQQLLTKQRRFRRKLFLSLDPDQALLEEIMP